MGMATKTSDMLLILRFESVVKSLISSTVYGYKRDGEEFESVVKSLISSTAKWFTFFPV